MLLLTILCKKYEHSRKNYESHIPITEVDFVGTDAIKVKDYSQLCKQEGMHALCTTHTDILQTTNDKTTVGKDLAAVAVTIAGIQKIAITLLLFFLLN